MSWRSNASLANLQAGARLRRAIRQWMDAEQILEVCTPVLSRYATTDPHVHSVVTTTGHFLHTSPEFAMKRLLAVHAELDTATAPDLYQLAPVFRAEESGRFHNSEFTLLEWYRLGMNHLDLMRDVERLLKHLWQAFSLPWPGICVCRYGVAIHERLGLWPEQLSVEAIEHYFERAQKPFPNAMGQDLDAALDLFMDEFVLPDFSSQSFTILTDYPVSQAALARLGEDVDGRQIAQRFEVYFGQVELANGFHELNDGDTQRQRFENDLVRRRELDVPIVPMDERFLEALAIGLPDCAGIALGLERLHMVLGKHDHIDQVLSFNHARA